MTSTTGWKIDDAARLRTLQDFFIADAPPEDELDAITQEAAALCGAPVALVTMLGTERQWFRAKTGTELTGTTAEQAICVHTLRNGDTLIIPDLTTDPRTASNTLVTDEPRLRFYAGAPVVVNGQALGTLCVLDVAPHLDGLSDTQRQGLEALAKRAVAIIESRRA